MTPGDRVIYHHPALERDLRAVIVASRKRGVIVRFDDPSERSMYGVTRFLTHAQAAVTLSEES